MKDNNTRDRREYMKAYNAANRDKRYEQQKADRAANPSKYINYQREYKNANRERLRAHGRAYYADNREQAKVYHATNRNKLRGRRLFREYGITLQDYDDMYLALGGHCQICGAYKDTLVVDHDHKTGEIRGLLCGKCNTGLGRLEDSLRLIDNAANYLRSNR